MKFSLAAPLALLGATFASANKIPGDLQVTNFLARLDTKGHTQISSFTLSGSATKNKVVCRANDPVGEYEDLNDRFQCGSSAFSFVLTEATASYYTLYVWEQYPEPEGEGYFSPGRGGWVFIPIACTKGPNGSKCLQNDGFVGQIYLDEQ